VALIAATVVGNLRRSTWVDTWAWPLHAAAAGAALITFLSSEELLAPADARLTGAALLGALGLHLLANRSSFEDHLPVDSAAAIAFVAGGGLAATWLDPDLGWTFVLLLTAALGGAVAAALVERVARGRRTALLIMAVGYSVIPVAAAAMLWGPLAREVGYLLIVSGGALAAYGVTARRLVAFEGAVVVWMASMLVLLQDYFTQQLHATVVLVAIVLLSVLEAERFRHRREGEAQPEAMRVAEWVVMTVPLVLATTEMFTNLGYGLLLAAEGLALTVWGAFTRVRRRAVVGLTAVTAAIVLAVMIPTIEGVRHGLTGGTWLVIGAVAAVVLIAAGSLIEKHRAQIGDRLAHWEEILESWD
jgi:hypothetical protein